MSRIGRLPVQIPEGVTVDVGKSEFTVKGPKGSLSQKYEPLVEIQVDDSEAVVKRLSESKRARGMHGLYRKLLWNMVQGVTQGFERTLEITGVGYRAERKDDVLTLNLGFSMPIEFVVPEDVEISCEGANKVIVRGTSRERVGQIASEIRSLRPPEPYKGKGIKYADERIRRKVGKSGVK